MSQSEQNGLPEPDPYAHTYFLDESISLKPLITAMRVAGLDVKVLKEEFHSGALDVEWLPPATAKGWVLLTKDDKWRYRQAEKEILIDTKAKAFVFVSKSAKGQEIADAIMGAMKKIAKIVETEPPPFVAHVYLSGQVLVVYPSQHK